MSGSKAPKSRSEPFEAVGSAENPPDNPRRAEPGPRLPRLRLPILLLGLVLAVLLPALALGGAATWYALRGENIAAVGRLQDTVRALALAMDQKIAVDFAALDALVTSPALGPDPAMPDLPVLYAQARRIAEKLDAMIFVASRDGTPLLTTSQPLGTPLPRIASTALVERVFLTGLPAVGDLVLGAMSGRLTVPVVVPVFRMDGSVAVVVAVSTTADKIQALLHAASVPNGASAAVSDAKGIIVAFSDPLLSPRVGHPVTLESTRAFEENKPGLYRATSGDGVRRVIAFQKLNSAPGWTMAVAQPAAVFDAVWQTLLLALAGGSVFALFLSMSFASVAARRILVPLRQMSMHARMLAIPGGSVPAAVTPAGSMPPAQVLELEELRRGVAAAEDALRRHARNLGALFQVSPIGIARFGFDGRVLDANDAMLRIFGATNADLVAGRLRWDDRSPPEFHDVTQRAVAEAMAAPDGRCRPYEKEYVRPDGTRVPVLLSFSRQDRVPGEAAGCAMDLTDIRTREALLRVFVDRTPAAIAMFDLDMRYLAVSRRFIAGYRIEGETPRSLVGRSHYEVFPDIPARWLDIHRRVLAGETVSAEDDAFPRQDGETDWVSWEMTPWQQADGSPGGALLFSEVVTERRHKQLELARSEARLRGLLDTVTEGIILAAEDGCIVSVNPAATRIFGFGNAAELVGRPLTILMPAREASRHDGYLAKHQTTGKSRIIGVPGRQLFGCRRDGSEFPMELAVSSFHSGNTRYLTGVLRDITERKRTEAVERHAGELENLVKARTRELEETQAQLVQAAKMEALGRLASGVAHDFNNTLQIVESSVELAIQRLITDPGAVRSALEIAAAAAESGAAVTSRLLSFARRDELLATPIAPAALLDGVAQLLRHTLGPSVTLRVEAGPDVPALLADRGQLQSVLVNLANNARDALVKGVGTICLTAAAAARNEASVRLAAGQYVRLSVVDDGVGMSAAVMARVTEAFFTTKPKGEGTGLGVAMAAGFAERSGGALTIESAPGHGTTVSLWFPVAPAGAAEPSEDAATGIETPPRVSSAILLVDDEPGLRAVLAALLADEGDTVTEAEDAAAALALLRTGLQVDVLLTDFAMPGGMNGLELVREARRHRPGLPAVLVTGHPGEAAGAAVDLVSQSGPFAVLSKPFSVRTLTGRLAALLSG